MPNKNITVLHGKHHVIQVENACEVTQGTTSMPLNTRWFEFCILLGSETLMYRDDAFNKTTLIYIRQYLQRKGRQGWTETNIIFKQNIKSISANKSEVVSNLRAWWGIRTQDYREINSEAVRAELEVGSAMFRDFCVCVWELEAHKTTCCNNNHMTLAFKHIRSNMVMFG